MSPFPHVLLAATPDINTEGMDWYTYGGRETGNTSIQSNLFNSVLPRPLNRYVANNVRIFSVPL